MEINSSYYRIPVCCRKKESTKTKRDATPRNSEKPNYLHNFNHVYSFNCNFTVTLPAV